MIKAGALYMVIIISLLIGMISISILTVAFFYRQQLLEKKRIDRLTAAVESATVVLLGRDFFKEVEDETVDLYGDQQEQVILSKEPWGVYEVNTVKAFEVQDTLKHCFLSANSYLDQSAIYLADEDRPLSLSGDTRITGDGEFPKSGLRKSYVEGKGFSGKELIHGRIKDSSRELPPLNEEEITRLLADGQWMDGMVFPNRDSVENSFFNETHVYQVESNGSVLANVNLKGRIVLVSDTILRIKADVRAEDIQIYAPAIIIESGFRGSCQLFARDSVVVGKDCDFTYPSFIGVFKPDSGKIQSKIELGDGSRFSGILFSYEKEQSDLQTLISIGEECLVKGEIYATGYVKLGRTVEVNGKVSAKRFIMQTPSTLYENYLIDVVLNRPLLSKYYLSSSIFKRENSERQVLKWLN